jgi:hypothetical protein
LELKRRFGEPLKIRVCSRENGKRIQKDPENSREELLMI